MVKIQTAPIGLAAINTTAFRLVLTQKLSLRSPKRLVLCFGSLYRRGFLRAVLAHVLSLRVHRASMVQRQGI